MKISSQTLGVLILCIGVVSLVGCDSSVGLLTLEIGNRLYPNFHETIETRMNEETQIGDSDYYLKVVSFYPDFAIMDSEGKVVSLSDEPKNPACKIMIYKNGEVVEEAWAFFKAGPPHYARTSFLTFRIVRFEYRGQVFEGIRTGDV